jgi:hypothetical protein
MLTQYEIYKVGGNKKWKKLRLCLDNFELVIVPADDKKIKVAQVV